MGTWWNWTKLLYLKVLDWKYNPPINSWNLDLNILVWSVSCGTSSKSCLLVSVWMFAIIWCAMLWVELGYFLTKKMANYWTFFFFWILHLYFVAYGSLIAFEILVRQCFSYFDHGVLFAACSTVIFLLEI